jgi:hypothetical protein
VPSVQVCTHVVLALLLFSAAFRCMDTLITLRDYSSPAFFVFLLSGRRDFARMCAGLRLSQHTASRLCKDPAAAQHLIDFLLQREHTAPQAYGHRDIVVDGNTFTLQPRLRTQSIPALYDKYKETVAGKPKRERVGPRMFFTIVKQLFPRMFRVCTACEMPCPP